MPSLPLIEELSVLATGRTRSLFADDVEGHREEIESQIQGRRVLVIGGAGSIGAATVQILTAYHPRALHVVDHNENGLAELVRDLRSRREGLDVADFRALPFDFGSPIMRRFLTDEPPYDHVLNFAALKHVRTEKDVYSLLQMIDTNVLKPAVLLRWLGAKGSTQTYFCVSTDKAANPVNLMGASKRLMEHVIFGGEVCAQFRGRVTSARFANVAFSEGSLLHSFRCRLEKRQPLAVPQGTRRFFVSLQEAGQICVLAALCAPTRHLLIPRLDPATDLRCLDTIAAAFLKEYGFEPRNYGDESECRMRLEDDVAHGFYPLLLTPLDTSGEKPYEEFVGNGEQALELGMRGLLGVAYAPAPPNTVPRVLDELASLVADPEAQVTKDQLVASVMSAVPQLRHAERGRHLDDRM